MYFRNGSGDKRIRVAQCGQAGENKVLYACVLNELKHVNGRAGLGAVMGSKNLRAIAVRGTGEIAQADPDKVREIRKEALELIPQSPLGPTLKRFGTPVFLMANQKMGILPTKNFKLGLFEGAEAISAEAMEERVL